MQHTAFKSSPAHTNYATKTEPNPCLQDEDASTSYHSLRQPTVNCTDVMSKYVK